MTTEERIIEAAINVCGSKGILATQMKEIAELAKINRRTLYRYFPTKEDLLCKIQLKALDQLNRYMTTILDQVEGETGFQKLKSYFSLFDLDEMRLIMYFTAQFDSHFNSQFIDDETKAQFIELQDPSCNGMYHLIEEGLMDKSIRNDLSATEIYQYISQTFYALYQRIILQHAHLDNIYSSNVNYEKLFVMITLDGIKSQPK